MNKIFNQMLTVVGFIVLVAAISYGVIYASNTNNNTNEKFNWACQEGCHNMYIDASQHLREDTVKPFYQSCKNTCEEKYLLQGGDNT